MLDDRRHVGLEGGCNVRDLGGYATSDGRRVRWRRIYRSGVLDGLTDADRVTISALGLRSVIDLRALREREARPSALAPGLLAATWARPYEMSVADHSTRAPGKAPRSPEELRRGMLRFYRLMLTEQADGYRRLFMQAAEGRLPLLLHCTGGKDRTGIGAALLLDTLGVPREDILTDYELTDACLARDRLVLENPPRTDAERMAITPLLRADPEYLMQTFDEVDTKFGSADAYARTVLGLDDAALQNLKDNLLEPRR